VGDDVRLRRNEVPRGAPGASEGTYSPVDFERRAPMLVLAVGFVVLVVALGRAKGLRALCGLTVSVAVVFAFAVPAILAGRPPLAVAVVGALGRDAHHAPPSRTAWRPRAWPPSAAPWPASR
jgi:uncharacterized membrane protein